MPKPRIDYAGTRRLILVMMYEAFIRDERMEFGVGRVRAGLLIPKNVIEVTLDQLEDDGLIEETTRRQTRTVGVLADKTVTEWVPSGEYVLTTDGRKEIEKITDEAYDLSVAALANGSAASVYQPAGAPNISPPPDRWEPLPLELGDPAVQQVRAALDDLASLVERDNGYKAEFPEERAEVLSALVGAKTLFDNAGLVTYTSLVTYVVWPLEKLLGRFSKETIIGAAGTVLWQAVKDWVKKQIGVALDDVFKVGK